MTGIVQKSDSQQVQFGLLPLTSQRIFKIFHFKLHAHEHS